MRVLVTTSGTGSRLGEITRYLNKTLVRLGRKPTLSYIIELYPKNTEFVITLGYKGDQVKDFLSLAYPDRKFTYVRVKKYEGPGTSLGYSMLQAEKKLQVPFVYHACDTIVPGFKVPSLKENWSVGMKFKDMTQYASFDLDKKGYLTSFNPKGFHAGNLAHIGLVGIKDYKEFWRTLRDLYKEDPNNSALNDTITLNKMIMAGTKVRGIEVKNWLDIGNLKALEFARSKMSDRFDNPDKVDEAIYFFDKFAIKFFADFNKVTNRAARGKILGKLVPKTLAVKKNFYKYKYIKGKRYSDVVKPSDISSFLNWSMKNLWKPVKEVDDKKFQAICREFYATKTKERIDKFFIQTGIKDEEDIINGEKIPSVKHILARINFDELSKGKQRAFHGDYILENILKVSKGYVLLDWRQDFGGLLRAGDMHYDLAKFYHNLVVNHDYVNQNKFKIDINGKSINCSIQRKKHLVSSEHAFEKEIVKKGLDLRKIRILRALIWLNMSPLHSYPFNVFLFYYGKYHLWQATK